MAKSIASLFSGVSGIDDSALNAFKTPEQVREEQLDKLRQRSTAQATLLGGIGQRASTALPGIFGSFAASQLPEMAVDLNQATRRGLLGAGSVAGATGRPNVQQALQQAAVSPEERQAGATQEALRQLQGSSPEEMMTVARELQQRGNVQGAQIIMQMAREAQLSQAEIASERALEQQRLAKAQETRNQPPATETIIEGDEKVTYQWDPEQQKRVEIARGPRYKPGTEVNINQGEGAFDKQLGQDMSQQYTESVAAIQNASKSLENLNVMEGLLDQGVITGTFANSRTAVEKALASAGLIDGQRVTNTETFLATGAQQTLALLQTGAAGAGTGISDADREFMEKAAGGNITVTEEAIRRIIRINRQIARNVYGTHNQIVNDIKNTFPNSEASKRLTERYYVGQRARKADGTIIVFDGQGWVQEQ